MDTEYSKSIVEKIARRYLVKNTLQGLHCLSDENVHGPEDCNCEQCPYDCETCGVRVSVDALKVIKALLEEQTPHLMTLQETLEWMRSVKPVWLEVRNPNCVFDNRWAMLTEKDDGQEKAKVWSMSTYVLWDAHPYRLGEYGREWRCWTLEPSEDERLAAHWNE